MEKNCEYCGIVSALGTEGEGIINIDGTTAFVPFSLVGERVTFTALKVKGNVAYGKLKNVESKAYMRVNPPCPVFGKCGGCSLQHMDYGAQTDFKRELVARALNKIGGIDFEVENTVPCDREYRYRNKLALPIGVDGRGETVLGFYAPHSHRIVPISDCLIQSEWAKTVISAVKTFMREANLAGFDEEKRTGDLRRVVVREIDGKFIIAIVAARNLDLSLLAEILEKAFEKFTLLLNVNGSAGNAIFGKEWHICRGEGYFDGNESGIVYRAGANTFVQVNDDVRAKLYARVLGEAEEGATALDLYSGGGLLTAMLAKKCGRAYGVEIVEEASRCADELKARNGLEGRMFNVCGEVENKLDEVFAATEGGRRIIVCDPPRKGMERSVVRAVARSGADKIILISCNPSTLARDLGLLLGTLKEEGGALVKAAPAPAAPYKIESITPYDMFPQTPNVETLVVLSHKKPDSHIEVTVDFENGKIKKDGIIERAESKKPKEKPTYKMIQKWVEENYGFKVHTAYIAEVKRDLGLPMYDAPNAVEELKRPRAHPTPKMVEAIKAALNHFEIID